MREAINRYGDKNVRDLKSPDLGIPIRVRVGMPAS